MLETYESMMPQMVKRFSETAGGQYEIAGI